MVSTFASGIAAPVDLAVGVDGSLYYLARDAGSVFRISAISRPPVITQQPVSVAVRVGQPATFTVAASGTGPLSYQWRRDGVDIAGATGPAYTLPLARLSDSDGTFQCIVSNASGNVISAVAVLTVSADFGPRRLPKAPLFEDPPLREY